MYSAEILQLFCVGRCLLNIFEQPYPKLFNLTHSGGTHDCMIHMYLLQFGVNLNEQY